MNEVEIQSNSIQSNFTFIALNLHLMTDSKVIHPCHIQPHSLFYHLPDSCGRKPGARKKPTPKSWSGIGS